MPRIIIVPPVPSPRNFPSTRAELERYKVQTRESLRPATWPSRTDRTNREEDARWALTWLRIAFRKEARGKYTRGEIALMSAKDIEAKINVEERPQL